MFAKPELCTFAITICFSPERHLLPFFFQIQLRTREPSEIVSIDNSLAEIGGFSEDDVEIVSKENEREQERETHVSLLSCYHGGSDLISPS